MSLFTSDVQQLGTPYWWEDGAPLPDLPSQLPNKAELLIVGAGYTGLSAAIAAHDAGASVVVVDAGVPGCGASSRNGGMFGAHPRVGMSDLAARFGEQTATGIFNEARDAFDFTSNLIKNEGIECCFDQCGRIQMAWTEAHFKAQRELVAALRSATSMNVELVSHEQLKAEINSSCYFGAIRFPDHASVQPRQFHDGLMSAVLQRGIQVVQQCAIQSIEKKATHFVAKAENGTRLVAEKVIMATNGYTSGKFGWFYRRVFPLPSFLIATEPLSSNLLDYLAPGRRMMVETRARHSYFRISPDGTRVVFGGRASMRAISAEHAAKRLFATMTQIWPELTDVKLTHSWMGNTGFTFTNMPQVGTHNGLFYSMGYSGSGVALAPYLGAKVAWQALDDDRGRTSYGNTAFKTNWIHPVAKPHFLKAASLWFDTAVDRQQDSQARRDWKQKQSE